MIKDEELQWFGGKPMSVAANMRWSAAVKRDSKINPQFVFNRVPVFPIKSVKRIVGPSILQNLNSSLDLNPFPISKTQEAEDEKALVEKQTGGRRTKHSIVRHTTAPRIAKPRKHEVKIGGRKKRAVRRK